MAFHLGLVNKFEFKPSKKLCTKHVDFVSIQSSLNIRVACNKLKMYVIFLTFKIYLILETNVTYLQNIQRFKHLDERANFK